MKPVILSLILLIFNHTDIFSQEKLDHKSAFTFEASYVSDILNNFSGGIETASSNMGMIDLSASIDFENLGLWEGGELLLHLESTHGGTPSGNLIGDLQVASNIDNGNFTYLYELLYSHRVGDVNFIIGKQDLNAEFFVSNYAGEYVNSSFGIMPTASLNAPVAIFPKTALAATIKYRFSDKLTLLGAIYDGNPLDLDADPYSTDFTISSNEGYMTFGELHLNTTISQLTGSYKIGFFKHSADFVDITDAEKIYKGNFGVHLIAEQFIYQESNNEDQGLGLFFKSGYAPDSKNLNDFFLALGANYYGIFANRDHDVLGLALAHASISNQLVHSNPEKYLPHETTIEFTYSAKIIDYFTVKPDIQYILNTGADAALNDTIVGILRFEISF